MKTSPSNPKTKSAADPKKGVHTPVPPQVQYPLEKPDSKKNQQTQPGNESTKK